MRGCHDFPLPGTKQREDAMKHFKLAAAGAMAALATASLIGCSSGSGGSGAGSASGSKPDAGQTLTYWATNQGSTLQADSTILSPELAKFTAQTGIKVNLQVIPWTDDSTKILAATASGKGPDVLNLGNTNAWTFGKTGGLLQFSAAQLAEVGGSSRFIPTVLSAAGSGPYTSLPLYSQAYGLFYNKSMFNAAGLTPPTTWADLLADAKKLTNPATQTYGLALQGASVSEGMHFEYIFARQNGGSPFNAQLQADFDTPANVAAIQQYIGLMSGGLVNPSDAQQTGGTQQTSEFAHNKAGMIMVQNGTMNTLATLGMTPSQYGVVPIPAPSPLPAGGKSLASFVAGTNIAIFKNTPHLDAALQFVKFMTSSAQQQILDKQYQLLPVLTGAPTTFLPDASIASTFTTILNTEAEALPVGANITAYQQAVGAQMVTLMGKAATGSQLSASDIQSALTAAQAAMPTQ
jgi:multiple sugar transport system substrate-binding protein